MESKSWCSPGQLVMLMLAGWINRHQQVVIAYQKEEIRVLREMLGGKRLRFTDEQRRRLALKAKVLSACTLKDLGPLVTPDTLCRWFRKYAGAKYDSSGVRRILGEDGIEPAPERRKHMPWATFLKAHWGAIAAMDLKTRHVEVAGIVREAYERWMLQVLRNLTDALNGFLLGKTHLIMDRDQIFTVCVREMLRHAGANPVRLPRRSPNLNAFIERFIRSIKEDCLDRVIPLVRRERLGGLLNYYYREAA